MQMHKTLMLAGKTGRKSRVQNLPVTDPSYGAYRDMLDAVASAVNHLSPDAPLSEQLEALTPELETALTEYGIAAGELSSPLLDTAAESILDGIGDRLGDVTADDIAALLSAQGGAQ